MAVKVTAKAFDVHRATEHIALQDSLGRKRIISVNMNGETCAVCGKPINAIEPPNATKVEDAINSAIAEMEAEETKLKAYATARGYVGYDR